ncbi:hypothetical protein Tco_1559620, partial [Tanacetum coccineum]
PAAIRTSSAKGLFGLGAIDFVGSGFIHMIGGIKKADLE